MNSLAPRFARYQALTLKQHGPILEIVMGAGQSANRKLSTADASLHRELAEIWRDVGAEPSVRVALIRGEGKGFSAGGDLNLVEQMANDFDVRLVAGLLADISIAARDARIVDGHTRLGVAAGDHAAIVWPLLCGMARAKYYLLLCESVSGEEAERIGLVSLAVPEGELINRAFEVAERLAAGSQTAIRWTKYALNSWLRMAGPTFDTSLALEFMGFAGPDVREGIASLRQKRPPSFDGA
jgi:enoyl-CoA hydratase